MAARELPQVPRPPALRRIAEIIPRRSTRSVLLHLVRDVRDPRWRPLSGARRLAEYAHHDLALLRAARARLQSTADRQPGPIYVRAMATLCIAIADLEEARAAEEPALPRQRPGSE